MDISEGVVTSQRAVAANAFWIVEKEETKDRTSRMSIMRISLCCVIRKCFIQQSESSCWTHQTKSLAETVLSSVKHWQFAALILNHSNTSRCCGFGCILLGKWMIWWINLWSESFYCTYSPVCNNSLPRRLIAPIVLRIARILLLMWLISNSIQQFTILTAKVEFSDLSSGARLAISGEDGAASFCEGTTDIRQRLNVPPCYCLRERNASSRRRAKQLLRRARARDPSPAASVSSAVYFKTCCPLALTELLSSGCRNLPAPVSCDASLFLNHRSAAAWMSLLCADTPPLS